MTDNNVDYDAGYQPGAELSEFDEWQSSEQWDNAHQMANRIQYVAQAAPYLANDPEVLTTVAAQPIATDQLGYYAGAISAQIRLDGTKAALERMEEGRARAVWSGLTPMQQAGLQQMGYAPPVTGDDPEGSNKYLGWAGKGIGGAMGTVNTIVSAPVVSDALEFFNTLANGVNTLYRNISTDEHATLALATAGIVAAGVIAAPFTGGLSLGLSTTLAAGGFAGLAAGNAVAAFTGEGASLQNPTDWIETTRDNWNGEAVFSGAAQDQARRILNRSGLDTIARDIGWEMNVYETVSLFAATPDADSAMAYTNSIERVLDRIAPKGDRRREQLAKQLTDMMSIPAFKEAVDVLQRSKTSFGRDMARLIGLDPGDSMYRFVSGGLDAMWSIVMDPTLLAGTYFKWSRARRLGMPLSVKDGDVFETVDAISKMANDHPSIGRAYDEIARAVQLDRADLLWRRVPDAQGLYNSLWDYKQYLIANGELGEKGFTREHIFDHLKTSKKTKDMLAGWGVKEGYGRLLLPTYGWTIPMTSFVLPVGKVWEGMTEAINFADNNANEAHLRKIAREASKLNPYTAPETIDVAKNVRGALRSYAAPDEDWNTVRALVNLVDRLPVIKNVERMTGSILNSFIEMMPATNSISMVGPQSYAEIRKMVGLGRLMGMNSIERRNWFNTIVQQDNVEQRINASLSFLDTLFGAGGARTSQRGQELTDIFVKKYKQRYGIADTDNFRFEQRTTSRALHPYQQTFDLPVPSLKELRQYAQKGYLWKYAMRIADVELVDDAMNKVWKPLVLLRIGFILRAGSEELLALMARAGPSALLAEFGARSIAEGRLHSAGLQLAEEAGRINPLARKAIEDMRYVAHVRPLERMFASWNWSRPAVEILGRYSDFVRHGLEHGLFSGTLEARIGEGRRLAIMGKQGGFRHAILDGIDPDLIRYAESYGRVHSATIMRELSSTNASVAHDLSSRRPNDPNDFTIRYTDNEGELQELGFAIERGNFRIYNNSDPMYDRMAHSSLAMVLNDPVEGPPLLNVLSRWVPDTIPDEVVYGMLERVRRAMPVEEGDYRLRLVMNELFTADDWTTTQWDSMLRQLADEPVLQDMLRAGFQHVGEELPEQLAVLDVFDQWIGIRYEGRSGGLTKYGQKLRGHVNDMRGLMHQIDGLGPQERAFMGAFLERWGSVPDDPYLLRSFEEVQSEALARLADRYEDPDVQQLVSSMSGANRLRDGTIVAHIPKEGYTRVYVPFMTADSYGRMVNHLQTVGQEQMEKELVALWVANQDQFTGLHIEQMEPIVKRFVNQLAGSQPAVLMEHAQTVSDAGRHGSLVPLTFEGYTSSDVAERLSAFIDSAFAGSKGAIGDVRRLERKGQIGFVDVDDTIRNYNPMDVDGTKRPVAYPAHNYDVVVKEEARSVDVEIEVPDETIDVNRLPKLEIQGDDGATIPMPSIIKLSPSKPVVEGSVETGGIHIFNRKTAKDLPPDAVYVGRPGPFGNPFSVKEYGREGAIEKYEEWINQPEQAALKARIEAELGGKDLVCFCYPQRCHAQVIAEIANGAPAPFPPGADVIDNITQFVTPDQVEFHIITGGRDYADSGAMTTHLTRVQQEAARRGKRVILVEGGARGADTLAAHTARQLGINVIEVPADWDKVGRAAGFARNDRMASFGRRMLDEGYRVDVVRFPGGKGTAHMATTSTTYGLPVYAPATAILKGTKMATRTEEIPEVLGLERGAERVYDRVIHSWALDHRQLTPRVESLADQAIITLPNGKRAVGADPRQALREMAEASFKDTMSRISSGGGTRRVVTGEAFYDAFGHKRVAAGTSLHGRQDVYDKNGDVIAWDDKAVFNHVALEPGADIHDNWTMTGPLMRDAHNYFNGHVYMLPDTRAYKNVPATIRDMRAVNAPDLRTFRGHYTHVSNLNNPPAAVLGPQLVPKQDPTRFERIKTGGFERIISPAIDAMVRRPLAFHMYAEAMRENERAARWMLSTHLFGDESTGDIGELARRFSTILDNPEANFDMHAVANDIRAANRVLLRDTNTALERLDDEDVVMGFLGSFGDDIILHGDLDNQANAAVRTVSQIATGEVKVAWRTQPNATIDQLFRQTRVVGAKRLYEISDGSWVAARKGRKGLRYVDVPESYVSSTLIDLNAGLEIEVADKYGEIQTLTRNSPPPTVAGPTRRQVTDAAWQWATTGKRPDMFAPVQDKLFGRLKTDLRDTMAQVMDDFSFQGFTLKEWDDSIKAARRVASVPRYALPWHVNTRRPVEGVLDAYENLLGPEMLVRLWGDVHLKEAVAALPEPMREVLDKNSWAVLSAAHKNRAGVQATIEGLSAERAIKNSMPYLDSHELRSQAGEYVRGFFPFMYAEQNFMKRWARTLKVAPDAIRKGQLVYMGLKSGGVVRTDANGRDWFVYPGMGLVAEATNYAMQKMGLGEVLPTGVVFQSETSQMIPGFDIDRTGMASANPLAALPLAGMTHMFHELRPIQEAAVGRQGVTQGGVAQFIPTTVRRLWNVAGNENSNVQYASAMVNAITILEHNGHGLPEDATANQLDEFIRRVRNHTRGILFAQAIVGFITPGSPTLAYTGNDSYDMNNLTGLDVAPPAELLRHEYLTMVQEMGIEDGTIAYLEANPDADIESLLAYAVGQSTSVSGAPLPATAEAVTFYDEHQGWIGQYPMASAWLLPQPKDSADAPFDEYAYTQQAITGFRQRRTPTEFLRALQFKEGSLDYFKTRDLHELAMQDLIGDDVRRKALTDAWDIFATRHKALHPIFAEELEGGASRERRSKVIEELRYALNDPSTPDVSQKAAMKEMLDLFDLHQATHADMSEARGQEDQRKLALLEQSYEDIMTTFLWRHPELEPFWLSVIRPEASLPVGAAV